MKKIILTGANGDIGFAIAQRLVADNYYLLLLNHHPLNDRQRALLKNCEEYLLDLKNGEEIATTFADIHRKHTEIYGLVNNAGVYPIVPFEDYTLDKWEEVMQINLTAPFLTTKAVLPLMKTSGGKIVNISSTGGHLGSRDAAYSSSKAGLIGLTKSTARSLATYNITVNAVAPGMIQTKMSKRMTPESIQKNLETSLIKRPGVPNDIVGVVSFLLSSDADYITGFTIDVNGGLYIR